MYNSIYIYSIHISSYVLWICIVVTCSHWSFLKFGEWYPEKSGARCASMDQPGSAQWQVVVCPTLRRTTSVWVCNELWRTIRSFGEEIWLRLEPKSGAERGAKKWPRYMGSRPTMGHLHRELMGPDPRTCINCRLEDGVNCVWLSWFDLPQHQIWVS